MRVFVVVATNEVKGHGDSYSYSWVAYAGIDEARANEAHAEIESRNNSTKNNISRPYSAEIEVWVDGVQT